MSKKKPMTYEEMLEKYPEWVLEDTNTYGREETPELTERARQKKKRVLGIYVRFMQDHGLLKRVLCDQATQPSGSTKRRVLPFFLRAGQRLGSATR
jgi:hypothetical protein